MLPLVVVISQVPPVAVRGTWTLPLVERTVRVSRAQPRGHNKHELGMSLFP